MSKQRKPRIVDATPLHTTEAELVRWHRKGLHNPSDPNYRPHPDCPLCLERADRNIGGDGPAALKVLFDMGPNQ